ncbi:MAG: hypothetical protein ACTS73_07190 [Arsenophonus sp. NEOnobi-MAG3]
MTKLEGGQNINLLKLSGLTELSIINEIQDHVAQAKKYSFRKPAQKGRFLIEKKKDNQNN